MMTRTIYNGVLIEDDDTQLHKPETTEEVLKYREFMCDSNNLYRCENCPANEQFSDWPGHRLPCGQFQCWVEVHTH